MASNLRAPVSILETDHRAEDMGALNRKNFIPVVFVALVIVIGLPFMIWLGFSRDSTGTSVHPSATNAVSTVAGVQAPANGAPS